ncbi:MAG: hypothetical protein JRH20_29670, partial [Deltaproteobacteria bacterium]|nr:hypothetical protein [Deltaproteobacteria bacterium]
MTGYLAALALTLALELPVALLILRKNRARVLLAGLVGNGLSHPALHFLLPMVIVPQAAPGPFILVGELSVFAFEALLYVAMVRPQPWTLAVVAAAAANALSFGVGL